MENQRTFLLLAIIALMGGISALIATHWCIGLFADSKYYLDAARNLLSGYGLSISTSGGEKIPLATWPPLFPALLALIESFGIDLSESARWLNTLA